MNKKSDGLTLVELIIVLAVIAVIGAILIPNFINVTDKARLKSDTQSARVLQNAIDLYNAEQTAKLNTASGMASVISELDRLGYISEKNAVLQTDGAVWAYSAARGHVVVDISGCTGDNEHIRSKVFSQLNDAERAFVIGNAP
ncbi:MAG: type II secretion system GspH family protein [Defluviitaleaceae bacterium]|nr:type II secretion system GspH family protein [Defluviitaleaceae bacterium]